MGCDIHLVVEVRDHEGAPWRVKLIDVECNYCDGKGAYQNGTVCYSCKGTKRGINFSSRNYDTFAVLANVRNGSGFAGCDTGDGFVPIDWPRGYPDDLSDAVKKAISDEDSDDSEDDDGEDRYERTKEAIGVGWMGDHSHSWLMLSELLAYDWKRVTKKRGLMGIGSWAAWKASGAKAPQNYCGDLWADMVRKVNETVAGELARCIRFATAARSFDDPAPVAFDLDEACFCAWESIAGFPRKELSEFAAGQRRLSIMVPVQWTETYAECSPTFHDKFIPALLAQGNGPTNTRIVFGFDS